MASMQSDPAKTFLKIRHRMTLLLCLFLGSLGIILGFGSPSFSGDTKDKPTDANQPTAKSGKPPSQVKEAHKALKSMDTKIPAETSKAVRSTKEFFKKRFQTAPESNKDHK